jgi:hypothetical protein
MHAEGEGKDRHIFPALQENGREEYMHAEGEEEDQQTREAQVMCVEETAVAGMKQAEGCWFNVILGLKLVSVKSWLGSMTMSGYVRRIYTVV